MILELLQGLRAFGEGIFQTLGLPTWLFQIVELLVPASMLLGLIALIPLVAVYIERKVAAHIQDRLGPMYVGWHGLLQTLADGLKLITKEDIVPRGADKIGHLLAPVLTFVSVYLVFLALPFDKGVVAADFDMGILYILAVGGLPVIGILIAGWASNNKYSLLGGLRAAAQLVSYEIALVMSLLCVVMAAGTLNLTGIVASQQSSYDGFFSFMLTGSWNIFRPWLIIPAIIYLIAGLAETNRTPFDIPEAESELVAGFNTEYSGMKFAFFFMAEFAEVVIVCFVGAIFFFGGWDLFGLPVPGFLVLGGKVFIGVIFFMWTRWTLPRMRVDRLMEFGWKCLVPMAFASIFFVGIMEKWLGA